MIDGILVVMPACLLGTHQRILLVDSAVSHSLDDTDEFAFILLRLAQIFLEVFYSFGQRLHFTWLLVNGPLLQ